MCSSSDTVEHLWHLQSRIFSTNNLKNCYATNLVDVVFLYGEVKHGIEIVKEIHHFHRGTLRGQAGKAYYVREVDGHRLEHLSLDYFAFLQLVGYNASFTVNERHEKRIVSKYRPSKEQHYFCHFAIVHKLAEEFPLKILPFFKNAGILPVST